MSIIKLITRNMQRIRKNLRFFPNNTFDYNETDPIQIPNEIIKERTNNLIKTINKNLKPTEDNANDGLYLGTAGISYMYYHLSKIPTFEDKHEDYLHKSLKYLEPAIEVAKLTKNPTEIPSFILGNCGIYVLASAVYLKIGDLNRSEYFRQLFYQSANVCKKVNFLSCGSDELFVGRAGYVLGALWLAKETKTEIQKKDIYEICDVMVESGRTYSTVHHNPCPLMYSYYQVEYLGAAHGLSSILQVLLSVPGYLSTNQRNTELIRQSIDYLLSIQDEEGNFAADSSEIGSPSELVHWCHGAPGIIYLMAKAFLVWKDPKYLESCERMGELVWLKGLLKKGPGICHGVAGSGYVFLLLYRLTNKPKYLYRALAFANFMETTVFKEGARTPDYPYSLYEGLAGTACFLGDLTNPAQATFPFSDVFD